MPQISYHFAETEDGVHIALQDMAAGIQKGYRGVLCAFFRMRVIGVRWRIINFREFGSLAAHIPFCFDFMDLRIFVNIFPILVSFT
mgnify:CR=1 FL=1